MAEVKLSADIFGLEVKNHQLLKLAYDAYLANSREAGAKTLKRGEVRGGGKKPWRQKGTGRARFGSTRNPIWRGGGIAFGPTGEQNFNIKISKRDKRLAVKQALSLANQENLIKFVEFKTTGKTSEIAKFLKENKFENNVLMITGNKTAELIQATSNIAKVVLINAMYLTVFHVLNADVVLIDKSGLDALEAWLGDREEK